MKSLRKRLFRGFVTGVGLLGLHHASPLPAREDTASKSSAPEAVPVTRRVVAEPVGEGPVVDGALQPEEWRTASSGGPLVQVEPLPGAAPTERTEFRILYDKENLYLGIWCFDRQARQIVSTEMARDGELFFDDHVTFVVDTFLDRRNGYLFRVNPNGAQADGLIADNGSPNMNWDGIWTARASIDEEGWYCELALPFTTLGFDPESSSWGFNLERMIRRKNEIDRWSGAQPHLFIHDLDRAGELTGLVGLEQRLGLQVTPYVLGTYVDDRRAGDVDRLFDAGVDLRYAITPNLVASFSYNTDFAETEVDARQINLTRFPLLFPEKREFFLQDEGIFQFAGGGLGGALIPFFSRRIGLSDDGEVVPIIAAAKMTGRIGDTNVGVLDALLDEHDGLSVRNAFVGRISQNILESSSVGAILTHGDPNSEDDSLLAGFDLNLRSSKLQLFGDDWQVHGSLFGLGTYKEGSNGGGDLAFGGNAIAVEDAWYTSLVIYQIGEDFDPTLGFVPRRDIRTYENIVTYRPRLESIEDIRRVFVSYFGSHITNLENDLETVLHSLTVLLVQFESGDEVFFNTQLNMDAPEEDFEIHPGVIIPPGEYWFPAFRFGVFSASKRPVSGQILYTVGDFYDGDKSTYDFELSWRPIKYVRLGIGYQLNQVRLPQGDFDTRLAFTRIQFSLTPQVTWSNFIQYDDLADDIGVNSRVRWEFRPGANLYVVFNQIVDRNHGRVRVEESELSVKVGIAFRF